MHVIEMEKKGKHVNTLERYHIHKISKNKLHMNDTYIDTHNPIFKILQEIDTGEKHTPNPPPTPHTYRDIKNTIIQHTVTQQGGMKWSPHTRK
jgi:hypothetical protein